MVSTLYMSGGHPHECTIKYMHVIYSLDKKQ